METTLLQQSGNNSCGFQGLISEESRFQSQPIISKNTSTMQPSAQLLNCEGEPGGRGMKDDLPVQHGLWETRQMQGLLGCAHSLSVPVPGIHPRHPAVPSLASPLPSDVLLQVKVFGKGLVAVSAFQLGGLWFP